MWDKRIVRTILIWAIFILPFFSVPLLSEAQRKSSPEVQSILNSAKDHFFAGRYNIALQLFDRALEIDPENSEAYSFSGDILLRTGRLDEAEKRFRIAAEIGNQPAQENFRLGQTLYLMKQRDRALESFQKSLSIDPTLHINRFYIGLVYLRLFQDVENTIQHWLAFRQLAPDDPQGPEIDRAIEILRRKGYTPELFADDGIGSEQQRGGGCYPVTPCIGTSPMNTQPPPTGQTTTGQSGQQGKSSGDGITNGGVQGDRALPGQPPAIVVPVPPGGDQPFMKGDPEAEKLRNKKKSIIEIEDL